MPAPWVSSWGILVFFWVCPAPSPAVGRRAVGREGTLVKREAEARVAFVWPANRLFPSLLRAFRKISF